MKENDAQSTKSSKQSFSPRPLILREKLKKSRRKQKQIKTGSLIEYGDPSTKVVVRLLPPLLEETEFRGQAKAASSAFSSDVDDFSYRMGKKPVKMYDEPNFSVAFMKFKSSFLAESFKREISQVSFEEKTTGDKIRCQVARPIFGELPAAVITQKLKRTFENDVYKLFSDRRSQTKEPVDISEVIAAHKKSLRRKNTKVNPPPPKSISKDLKQGNKDPIVCEGKSSRKQKQKQKQKPEKGDQTPKDENKKTLKTSLSYKEKEVKPKAKQKSAGKSKTSTVLKAGGDDPSSKAPPSVKPSKKKKKSQKKETDRKAV